MSTWLVRAPSHLGGVLPDSTQSQAQGRAASGGIALLVFSALRETQTRTHSGKNLRPHDGGGGGAEVGGEERSWLTFQDRWVVRGKGCDQLFQIPVL